MLSRKGGLIEKYQKDFKLYELVPVALHVPEFGVAM
jgi:hypothetical protein